MSWVAVQFLLMLAVLGAAPVWRGQWPGWAAPVAGGVLAVLGAWLGLRGIAHLGPNRTPFPRPKEGAQLVTDGLYARVRHPLYVSVMVLGLGWALLWRSFPALGLALAQIVFFDAKARREERWLRERFPGYEGYARRVKRFIPGLY